MMKIVKQEKKLLNFRFLFRCKEIKNPVKRIERYTATGKLKINKDAGFK